MQKVALAAFAALTVFATVASSRTHAPRSVNGILMSDVHFDPLADKSLVPQLIQSDLSQWDKILQTSAQKGFSLYDSDSNYALMTSAFAQAGARASQGIMIYTGDLLRHDFSEAFEGVGGSQAQYADFATKTAVFTVQKMQQAAKVPVIIALGNNDSTEGDYVLTPNSPFLAALSKEITVVANAQDAAVRKDFEYGGYYAIPNPTVRYQYLVVLNTVFWSTQYNAPAGLAEDPGVVELKWLEEKLSLAKAQAHQVSLVMHIPPGMDAFVSAKNKKPQLMWKEVYEDAFLALIAQYRDTITVSFAGHTHMDDFRVLPDAGAMPLFPIRVSPAVSPLFHNNPAFSVFTYRADLGDIHDITTFFVPLSDKRPTWKTEYKFAKTYGYHTYNAAALFSLAAKIRKDGQAFQNYQKLYDVSSQPYPITVTPRNWPYYSCAQTSFTADAYAGCVADNSTSAAAPGAER
ncbi:MAG: hypothetical protein JWN14_570 [Chthonomonadales bacterium]|nr:hypothetical protein [Chthonomonadales bacterium]